jgi:hypothetical protein
MKNQNSVKLSMRVSQWLRSLFFSESYRNYQRWKNFISSGIS